MRLHFQGNRIKITNKVYLLNYQENTISSFLEKYQKTIKGKILFSIIYFYFNVVFSGTKITLLVLILYFCAL